MKRVPGGSRRDIPKGVLGSGGSDQRGAGWMASARAATLRW